MGRGQHPCSIRPDIWRTPDEKIIIHPGGHTTDVHKWSDGHPGGRSMGFASRTRNQLTFASSAAVNSTDNPWVVEGRRAAKYLLKILGDFFIYFDSLSLHLYSLSFSLYIPLSVFLYFSLSLSLFLSVSIYLPIYISHYISLCLYIYISIYLFASIYNSFLSTNISGKAYTMN